MENQDQAQAGSNKAKPGVDNEKNDEAETQVINISAEETPLPSQAVEVADEENESKKSLQNQTQAVSLIEDNDDQKDKTREKSEFKQAQSVIENINQKDLQPLKSKPAKAKKSNEEVKNTTTATTTTTGELTNSRRSGRFKKVTQRFAKIEQVKKTPKVSVKKESIIVNGNDDQPNQPESLSTNSSGTQQGKIVEESKDKPNPEVEPKTDTKPSLMEKKRLSIALEKNVEEKETKDVDVIVRKRGRVPITKGKRVDELFIMKKVEVYERDGTWREEAVKIRDKIKSKNVYQCKTCKKSMDSLWKLYHHKQVHLEMNFYLCQYCLVGFNIPISRQLHENTCSRRTNGNSVMQNMLMLYKNQLKEKSQLPSTSTAKKCPELELETENELEMGEIKLMPKLKQSKLKKPKIIQKSGPVKLTIKRKAKAMSGSSLSSGNKTDDGIEIFSRRKKRMRTRHIMREGEPEFDASSYDWTKYSNRIKIAGKGKPGYKYFCLTCKKLQSSKENLFYHMLIHTNEWPYGCNYCERVFRVPSNRDKHEELKCLNRQSLSMNLSDMALKGDAPPPVLKKIKSEI